MTLTTPCRGISASRNTTAASAAVTTSPATPGWIVTPGASYSRQSATIATPARTAAVDDVYAANRRLHKYVGWLEAKVAELQADAGALIDIMMRLDK